MQRSDIGSRHQECRLLRPVVRRVSIGEIIHYFQRALFNFDSSDCGVTAIVSLLPLTSLFQSGVESSTENGVI